jgi:hypothetical protein
MSKRKRGRPHKWHPQIIAGWRFAKGKSIAETAKKWMVSPDTVKRACRDHGEGALEARQAALFDLLMTLTDRLIFVHEKRGGYLPVVLSLSRRIGYVELNIQETERAMDARGIVYRSLLPKKSAAMEKREQQAREWEKIFGFEDDEEFDGEWTLSHSQQAVLGW